METNLNDDILDIRDENFVEFFNLLDEMNLIDEDVREELYSCVLCNLSKDEIDELMNYYECALVTSGNIIGHVIKKIASYDAGILGEAIYSQILYKLLILGDCGLDFKGFINDRIVYRKHKFSENEKRYYDYINNLCTSFQPKKRFSKEVTILDLLKEYALHRREHYFGYQTVEILENLLQICTSISEEKKRQYIESINFISKYYSDNKEKFVNRINAAVGRNLKKEIERVIKLSKEKEQVEQEQARIAQENEDFEKEELAWRKSQEGFSNIVANYFSSNKKYTEMFAKVKSIIDDPTSKLKDSKRASCRQKLVTAEKIWKIAYDNFLSLKPYAFFQLDENGNLEYDDVGGLVLDKSVPERVLSDFSDMCSKNRQNLYELIDLETEIEDKLSTLIR